MQAIDLRFLALLFFRQAATFIEPPKQNDAMVTKQEIQTLLNEAIKPLERKIDNMTANFAELKRSVEFLDQKYEDVLSRLRLANEKHMQ